MNLTYKYRLLPNIAQSKALCNIFYICKNAYNRFLEERVSFYKEWKNHNDNSDNKVYLSYDDQSNKLPELKEKLPELKSIHSQTLQNVLYTVDLAFKGFFKRLKEKSGKAGFPRFKNIDRFKSILFPQCNLKTGGVKRLQNNKVIIKGVPDSVKVIWHRQPQGTCKQVQIVKHPNGNYYIHLICEDVPKVHRTITNDTVGIDLGLNSFIVQDDGIEFHHPKPYSTSKQKLAYMQAKLAKKTVRSNNRKKLRIRIAKQFEHINNIRNDFQHKLSNNLVKKYDKIIIEKLNIKSMVEAEGFDVSKSNILEASWGNFVQKLDYKAERANSLIIKVDPKNTSKTCSCCGNIQKITLKDRIFVCEACGFAMNRDRNAAINIKSRGLALGNVVVVKPPKRKRFAKKVEGAGTAPAI